MATSMFDTPHWWKSPRAYHVFYSALIGGVLKSCMTAFDLFRPEMEVVGTGVMYSLQILSTALIMWRFQSSMSSSSYLKLFIREKREQRCKIALSLLVS